MSTVGALVMAYGGPNSSDEIAPYLHDVRGFRETSPTLIDQVRRRYERIGGCSPILERTQAQAAALQRALDRGSGTFDTEVGMRHWHPYIGDALARLEERGIRHAVGLVMAPHYSSMSIALYYQEIEEAQSAVEVAPIENWHLLPGYVHALAGRVRDAFRQFPSDVRDTVPIIFTAHSLPDQIQTWNDPYPDQLLATVRAVIAELGDHPHRFAYQSAAMTEDTWLGPDVGDVVDELAEQGEQHVLVAPIGFVSEHVEILYDVDVELRQRAEDRGVHVERIEMLNEAPEMISDLADLVRSRARDAGWL